MISPTREHGKLRYSPRDLAIAGLIRRLIDAGVGVEGVRMLKRLAERDVRRSAASGEEAPMVEEALRILYQRKAFREETGMDEEHHRRADPRPRRARVRTAGPRPTADQDGTVTTVPAPDSMVFERHRADLHSQR